MKTKLNISTIAYQSDEFLQARLNELLNQHIIDFWAYVEHEPEEDEKHKHKHLIVYPSSKVDTNELTSLLAEVVPDNLPLKNINWCIEHKGAEIDWLLYGLHDVEYMKYKQYPPRKYTYTLDDFKTSDYNQINQMFYDAFHTSKFAQHRLITGKINSSDNPQAAVRDLALSGYVPIQNAHAIYAYTKLVADDRYSDKGYAYIKHIERRQAERKKGRGKNEN